MVLRVAFLLALGENPQANIQARAHSMWSNSHPHAMQMSQQWWIWSLGALKNGNEYRTPYSYNPKQNKISPKTTTLKSIHMCEVKKKILSRLFWLDNYGKFIKADVFLFGEPLSCWSPKAYAESEPWNISIKSQIFLACRWAVQQLISTHKRFR